VRAENGGTRFEELNPIVWAEKQLQPLEVSKGTLIVLNGFLPHKSLANTSPKSRHAYTLHVISGACDYPVDNWLQRSAAMPLRGF
jgi:phytanoyl-CoA hydroxylase